MNKLSITRILGYLAIVMAGCLSFLPLFWGLDLLDTFYLGCRHLLSDAPSVTLPLTQGIYILTSKLMGDYIIGYRIVNWSMYLLAYLLGFGLLLGEETRKKPAHLFLLALAILLIPITNFKVFAGNSNAVLFAILTFVALARMSENPNKWSIILCISLVMAALSRIPHLTLFLVAFLLVIIVCQRNDRLKGILSILAAVIIYLIINLIIQGGPASYIKGVQEFLISANESTCSNHSITTLLETYLAGFKHILHYTKLLAVFAAIPIIVSFFRKKTIRIVGIAIFAMLHLYFIQTHVPYGHADHYFTLIYCFANIFICVFIQCISALFRHNYKEFGLAIGAVLVSICSAAGSDSGLSLMSGPLFALTPWILVHSDTTKDELEGERIWKLVAIIGLVLSSSLYCNNHTSALGIVLVLAIAIVSCFAASLLPNKLRKFKTNCPCSTTTVGKLIIFIVIDAIAIYEITNTTFNDLHPKELDATYSISTLKGIKTNHKSVEFVDSVMSNYQSDTVHNKAIFFGFSSSVFCYLTRTGIIPGTDFSQGPYPSNLKAVEAALSERPTLYLCYENPAVKSWFTLDDYAPLDSIMTKHEYQIVRKEHYCVYYPLPKETSNDENSL